MTKRVQDYCNHIPDDVDEKKGLIPSRYIVTKRNGDELTGHEKYFVLRLDPNGDDPIWTKCCRKAARVLVDLLDAHTHLPVLTQQLEDQINYCEEIVRRREETRLKKVRRRAKELSKKMVSRKRR